MEPKFPFFNPTLYMWQPYLNALNSAFISQQVGNSAPQNPPSIPGNPAFPFASGAPPPPGLGSPAAVAAAMGRRLPPHPHFPLDLGMKADQLISPPSARSILPPEGDIFPKLTPQQLALHLTRPNPHPSLMQPTSESSNVQTSASHRQTPPPSPRSNASAESLSKHTLQSTKWAINVWNTWANQKNSRIEQSKSSKTKIPTIPELSKVKSEDLDVFLSEFITEVRRFDGEMYPPDSLMVLCAGVQRFLREDGNRPDLSFLDGYDKDYPKFQNALGQVVKDLQDRGIGTVKRKADTFNQEMEKELWNKGVLSFHSPKGLSRAVYFYITKGFWLRSRGDHRNLVVEDLQFGTDSYGQYVELAQRYFHPKKEQTVARKSQPVRHYNVDQKICRVFAVLSYYCKLIPPQGPLYRKPIEERLDGKTALFGSAAIGVHALERIPSELATEAGFDGYFTSRSVWVSDIPCHCNKYVMVLKSSSMIPLNLSGAGPHPSGVRAPPPHPHGLMPLNFNPVVSMTPHLMNPVSLASMVSHSMMASKMAPLCVPTSLEDSKNPLKFSPQTFKVSPSEPSKPQPDKIQKIENEYSRKRKLSLPSPKPVSTNGQAPNLSPMSLPPSQKQQVTSGIEFKKAEQLFQSFSRPLDLSRRIGSPESDSDTESSDIDIEDRLSPHPIGHESSRSNSGFPNLEKHVSAVDQQLVCEVFKKNEIVSVAVEDVKLNKTETASNQNCLTLKFFYE